MMFKNYRKYWEGYKSEKVIGNRFIIFGKFVIIEVVIFFLMYRFEKKIIKF